MRSAAGLERRWRRFKEDVRRPLTEWENAEKKRVKVREDRLKEIESLSIFDSQPEASDYERRLESRSTVRFRLAGVRGQKLPQL